MRAVVGKAFESAGSLQSTAAVPAPPSTASTAAANASPAALRGWGSPKIINPILHARTESKPSAVHAAQKWLAEEEVHL